MQQRIVLCLLVDFYILSITILDQSRVLLIYSYFIMMLHVTVLHHLIHLYHVVFTIYVSIHNNFLMCIRK